MTFYTYIIKHTCIYTHTFTCTVDTVHTVLRLYYLSRIQLEDHSVSVCAEQQDIHLDLGEH